MCTVLVLMFIEFSSEQENDAGEFLNGIEEEISGIRNELDAAGNILEDVLDDSITPLIDRFNAFFDFIEQLLFKDDTPEPLYE